MDIRSAIQMQLFKQLVIKTKNVHCFNPPRLNVRGERNMAYAGIEIYVTGNTICVHWLGCLSEEEED